LVPDLDIEAIDSRCDITTPEPWEAHQVGFHGYSFTVLRIGDDDDDPGYDVAAGVQRLADAEFIAHARTDVPALVAEVKRLRAALSVLDDTKETQ
jgi:hypothetical protein